MQKDIKLSVRELTRKICQTLKVISRILSPNYIHMFLETLPKLSVSEFMCIGLQKLALVKYSLSMQRYARSIGKRFWSRKYFAPYLVILQMK